MDMTLTELLADASMQAQRIRDGKDVDGSYLLELIDQLRETETPEAEEMIRLLANAALVR